MKITYRIAAAVIAAMMLLPLVSCGGKPEDTSTGPVTAAPDTTTAAPDTATVTETETEPETEPVPLEPTAPPTVEGTAAVSSERTIIYGSAEPDSVIRTVINGEEESNRCNSCYFYIEVNAAEPSEVSLYATAPGKAESEKTTVQITPQNEDKPVFGGRNSRIFYSPTLGFMWGNAADISSLDALSAYICNKTVPEIQKATGKETKIIYAIIPDPATAYKSEQRQYIADALPYNFTSAMESFVSKIDGCHKDVYALDLLSVMRAHLDDRIYFSTDTHYTEFGAYYAYLEIMKTVRKSYPDAKVRTVEDGDYTVEYIDVNGGDLCGMVGLAMREVVPFFIANFEDTGTYYVSKRNDGIKSAGFGPSNWTRNSSLKESSNPTVYFLGDSYGCYILPFIGANFSKVWTNEGVLWSYGLDKSLLEQNKPDYVILLVCQRNVGPDFTSNVVANFSMSVAGF